MWGTSYYVHNEKAELVGNVGKEPEIQEMIVMMAWADMG